MTKTVKFTKQNKVTITRNAKGEVVSVTLEPWQHRPEQGKNCSLGVKEKGSLKLPIFDAMVYL